MTRPSTESLTDYEVVLAVCGGIAAYKAAALASALVQSGCGVTVCMTANAQRFVGPVTFRALTGRAVFTDAWETTGNADIHHLTLTERADLLIVAPATANILGKLAHGIADELVSALLLGSDCPILMAPAMNTRMWNHPATQRNLAFLRDEAKVHFVGPDEGWLACRTVGSGRMSEPDAICAAATQLLKARPPRRRTAARPDGDSTP